MLTCALIHLVLSDHCIDISASVFAINIYSSVSKQPFRWNFWTAINLGGRVTYKQCVKHIEQEQHVVLLKMY